MIKEWDDDQIQPGQHWEDILIDRARSSRLFLLLLTNRFIASDFCVGVELTIARALERKRAAGIAAILAEDAIWEIEGLRDLQIIKPFDRAVSRSKRDRAWTEAARKVKTMADSLVMGTYFVNKLELPPVPPLMPYLIGRDAAIETLAKAL